MTGKCDGCDYLQEIREDDHGNRYCADCCPEAHADPEEDEEPNFDCGTCGGSGGGPEHWACPSCGGSGTNRAARKAYYDDRRGDEEYDRLKDEGRI